MSKEYLDARNLLCPMPVIKAQNIAQRLQQDDILEITCTDPGAKHDIPSWCRIHGHDLLTIQEQGREIVITIKINKQNL